MKPIASLSLDLDDKWSYMKSHGDAAWKTYPTYLPTLIPMVLEILKRRGLKITFFVVGRDALQEGNADVLRAIAEDGHEVANHSMHHDPWLCQYDQEQLSREIIEAEEYIERATGQRTVGFRGPGFQCSLDLLRILASRGYEYDASILPTFLAPLARIYYLMTTTMTAEERSARGGLFGSWRAGLYPLRPFCWKSISRKLLEIPVTTMPLVRFPMHLSYVIWLSGFSRSLANTYLRASLSACRLTGVEPSFLLHPLDFLGEDQAPELGFFPGMHLSQRHKLDRVERCLDYFQTYFHPVTLREHARRITRTIS